MTPPRSQAPPCCQVAHLLSAILAEWWLFALIFLLCGVVFSTHSEDTRVLCGFLYSPEIV